MDIYTLAEIRRALHDYGRENWKMSPDPDTESVWNIHDDAGALSLSLVAPREHRQQRWFCFIATRSVYEYRHGSASSPAGALRQALDGISRHAKPDTATNPFQESIQ